MCSNFWRNFIAPAAALWCLFLFDACALFAQESIRQEAGDQAGLQYSNERPPQNAFLLGLYVLGAYDDNVLNNNQNRLGDSILEGGGLLGFRILRPRGKMLINYRPTFELYRQFQGYDQFSHGAEFSGEYKLAPHFLVNACDSFSYRKGIIQPSSNGNTAFLPVVPGGLNGNVLVPLIRELTNQARVGAKFLLSRRSVFDFVGIYSRRDFENGQTALGKLQNTRGYGGGAAYQYRGSQATKLGLRYVYQDLHFGQGSHALIHSGYLTLGYNFGERDVSLEFFGGPQFASSRETPLSSSTGPTTPAPTPLPAPVSSFHRDVGGGATFNARSAKTVFRISLLRQLSEGGGVVALTRDSSEGVDIRRRLGHGLDFVFNGTNAQSTSFSDAFGRGAIRSQSAGIAFEYPLGYGFLFHVGYTHIRQRIGGNIPFAFDLDRNRAALGFFYNQGLFP